MSQENVEIVRQAVRAFNERDIEALVAMLDPAAEIELVGGFADVMATRFQGQEGARSFYTDWFATFKTMHVEAERFLEAKIVGVPQLDRLWLLAPAPTPDPPPLAEARAGGSRLVRSPTPSARNPEELKDESYAGEGGGGRGVERPAPALSVPIVCL